MVIQLIKSKKRTKNAIIIFMTIALLFAFAITALAATVTIPVGQTRSTGSATITSQQGIMVNVTGNSPRTKIYVNCTGPQTPSSISLYTGLAVFGPGLTPGTYYLSMTNDGATSTTITYTVSVM
jgi:hypothetical protein